MPRFVRGFPRCLHHVLTPVVPVLLVLLALATLACSGGGSGSSPTEPGGGAAPPANVAGSWTGTSSLQSVDGYCSQGIPLGVPVDIDLEITQTGSRIDVRLTNRPPVGSLTCQFVGTVIGNSFSLTPDFSRSHAGCGPSQDLFCNRQVVRRDENTDASRFEGTVSGNRIELRATGVFDFFDKQTGQHLGEATYRGTASVTRVQ